MQLSRIRSNNTIAQGFIHAELEFAFYRSPPPGVSDICYPELKLSTNAAQLVAFCLSSHSRPRQSESPKLPKEVELREYAAPFYSLKLELPLPYSARTPRR